MEHANPGRRSPDETEEWVLGRRFVLLLILILLAGAGARAADGTPVSDYVRLHVIADGDDARAQSLKMRVRDAALGCARTLLSNCADADAAWDTVRDNLPLFEAVARQRARALGYYGTIKAEAGVFAFPDRRYGDVLVPAGDYRALRVVIGKGKGRNWWCVLYPSLCLPEELDHGEPVQFHSVIVDWLRGLFGGEA